MCPHSWPISSYQVLIIKKIATEKTRPKLVHHVRYAATPMSDAVSVGSGGILDLAGKKQQVPAKV